MPKKLLQLPLGVRPEFVNQVHYMRGSFLFPVDGARFHIWEYRADDPRRRTFVRTVTVVAKIGDGVYHVREDNSQRNGIMSYDEFCQEAMKRDYREEWAQVADAV